MANTGPLVAGESARLILDTLRSFPLTVDSTGRSVLHDVATGEARAALDRAYERTEMGVMTEAARCSHSEAHRTLDAHEFRELVIHTLARDAKQALGELDRIDPLWMSPRVSPPIELRPKGW